jgi:hypothetical protein
VEGLRLDKATERPRSASPEVIADAEAAAKKGTDSLRKWWEAQPEDTRQLMLPRFRGLKETAKKVDAEGVSA